MFPTTKEQFKIIEEVLDHKKLAYKLAEKDIEIELIDYIIDRYKEAVKDILPLIK
jgi:hypothetical protein